MSALTRAKADVLEVVAGYGAFRKWVAANPRLALFAFSVVAYAVGGLTGGAVWRLL